MCGIAGIIGLAYDDGIIKRIQRTMSRRGPDDMGMYTTDLCCLLHTRLTVIDPEGGKQPMQLTWQSETYTIVYNGELYNTDEIRHQLLSLGHSFTGHSDTEVVLHGYAQWGEDILIKANGIFAFAVWEHSNRKLFVARDRMGVKPFFYMIHNNGFLFGSEIKNILAYPTVRPEIDEYGISQLLLLGPGRAPGSGIFCGRDHIQTIRRVFWHV